MCWSRLSSLFRPPWTPERPRYPIRLKVRLMDCLGRAGEGSAVPSLDTSSILVCTRRTVLWPSFDAL